MRILLYFAIGLLLGPLSWVASQLVSGKFEPFDNSTGFFLCQAVLAIPVLVIGLRVGMLRALLCLVGAWIGMNAYAYAFGSSETRAWIVLLLFSSLTLLVFPAVAGGVGGIVRAILRKSRKTTDTVAH
ncbi:MAG: hypothetical protein HOP03_10590 [Lysobacter sp.]|nr:hypothetical protein [Lysobacter sp.]